MSTPGTTSGGPRAQDRSVPAGHWLLPWFLSLCAAFGAGWLVGGLHSYRSMDGGVVHLVPAQPVVLSIASLVLVVVAIGLAARSISRAPREIKGAAAMVCSGSTVALIVGVGSLRILALPAMEPDIGGGLAQFLGLPIAAVGAMVMLIGLGRSREACTS